MKARRLWALAPVLTLALMTGAITSDEALLDATKRG